jgi:hypothetical protein
MPYIMRSETLFLIIVLKKPVLAAYWDFKTKIT